MAQDNANGIALDLTNYSGNWDLIDNKTSDTGPFFDKFIDKQGEIFGSLIEVSESSDSKFKLP